MNIPMNIAQRVWANKHTSIAAGVYIGSKVMAQLGAVWFPNHKEQFDQTASIIESAAVGYGFIMAGDAGATKPTEDAPKV